MLKYAVSEGSQTSSVYNGDGLRISHTVSGQMTSYIWDAAASLPVVLVDGTNTNVYGLDLISTTSSGGTQTYYLTDGLGSTVNLTDSAGNVTYTYWYDVWGQHAQTPSGGSNQSLFTGEQRDASGLYYLRARYYDPSIGRFLSQDPAKAGHAYGYAGNNPVNFVDPYGLDLCSDLGSWAGIDDCDEVKDFACKLPDIAIGCALLNEGPMASAADSIQDFTTSAAREGYAFASRFATLDCLTAGIGIAATFIMPGIGGQIAATTINMTIYAAFDDQQGQFTEFGMFLGPEMAGDYSRAFLKHHSGIHSMLRREYGVPTKPALVSGVRGVGALVSQATAVAQCLHSARVI